MRFLERAPQDGPSPQAARLTLDALHPRDEERFISSYSRSFAPGGGCGVPQAFRQTRQGSLARSSSLTRTRPKPCGPLQVPETPGPLGHSRSETQLRRHTVASPFPSLNGRSANPVTPASGGAAWERRRAILELLASYGLRDTAKSVFAAHDVDSNGRLEFDELRAVLRALDLEHGVPLPDPETTERLLKLFDVNGDQCLDFDEFFEMLVSALRRTAFDPSILMGRDFFVTKQEGKVWGNYEKLKKLGTGSFGETHLCKRRLAGGEDSRAEERAVKVVRKARVRIPVEDIEREIMVMKQVDHPNIVRLFEWYEDKKRIYLVMDFIRGGTLRDSVLGLQQVRRSALKEEWIRKVMRQVLEAMAYCHRLRLIHRDLKDENIMLLQKDSGSFSSDPFVVIIDLGVAEMFSLSDPSIRGIGGTPLTMAPEVWSNVSGPKCDVWSAGVILFELLSGEMPFLADSLDPSDWLKLHKKGPNWGVVKTSKASKDLCRSMLTVSEPHRPTMAECLAEGWFGLGERELLSVPAERFAGLESFCKETAVKRALLYEIASRLPMERAQSVVEVFKSFDVDHSGSVSREELRSAFARLGTPDHALADRTFEALDVNRDGVLSFSELSSGILLLFSDLVEERLRALFMERWDGKGEGLNAEGLRTFFDSAARLHSLAGARSARIMRQLEQESQHRRVRFEEVRELLLGSGSTQR